MEFPYQREKSKLFGDILRPAIEFEVETKFGWIPVVGYLDSGADITLLPMSFIKALGIEMDKDEIKEIRGIGEGVVSVILKNVRIKVANEILRAKVGIALIEDVPYLLGRKDIFNKFRIIFEEYNSKIIFSKPLN